MADPEAAEIAGDRRGVVETEAGVQLDPVGSRPGRPGGRGGGSGAGSSGFVTATSCTLCARRGGAGLART